MKLAHLIKSVAVILAAMTAPVAAGTFSQPTGLAVDPNTGNLYVANQLSNTVVVFDKNLVQQAKLTITAGLSQPISLAIDPTLGSTGTLYVGNIGSTPRITTYALGGTQISNNAFPAFRPYALAIGADHVLYEFDNASTLYIYNTVVRTFTIQSFSASQIQNKPGLAAIGSDNGLFFYGDGQQIDFSSEPDLWRFNGTIRVSPLGPIAGSTFAMNFDNFHNSFITDPTNKAIIAQVGAEINAFTLIKNLTSIPSGIALDKPRNRLFVSFPSANLVKVYTITYNANNIPTGVTFLKNL
jgi:DNA-binding beta-propeller fold protein YncE